MSWEIKAFDKNSTLVEELASRIAGQLRQAIGRRGSASLAVSGGSTPKSLFQQLSREELPWEYVWITLVDERWVDEADRDSNAGLLKEYLLQNRAAKANFVSLKSAHPSAFDGVAEVDERLRQLAMPFDVVVLGMGTDGHTASFFSGAETLHRALEPADDSRCAAIRPPAAPYERMTLTLPAILNARLVVIHIVGQDKWQVLRQAITPGSVDELPVRAVLNQQQAPVEIYYGAQG